MNTYPIYRTIPLSIFIAVASVSQSVSADGYGETYVSSTTQNSQTVSVSYADLNLTRIEGRETFERRLSKAAREVCGSTSLRDAGSLRVASKIRQCQTQAIAGAMNQLPPQQFASVEE